MIVNYNKILKINSKSEYPFNLISNLKDNIIETKKELEQIPVVANIDFGHTTPMITFPVGGKVAIEASEEKKKIKIIEH